MEAWEQRRPAAVLGSVTRVITGGASCMAAWAYQGQVQQGPGEREWAFTQDRVGS